MIAGEETKPIPQKTIEMGLSELRGILGEKTDNFLPGNKPVVSLSREDYQSSSFQKAEYDTMPEKYGASDRSVYIVIHADGSQTIVICGKGSSGNPYEMMHAVVGGLDLRPTKTTVYQYDGKETITESDLSGENNTYTGEFGKVEALMPHIKRRMGRNVGKEVFVQPDSTSSINLPVK